jgi:uncharacterized protein YjbI with pentapeptide repeats
MRQSHQRDLDHHKALPVVVAFLFESNLQGADLRAASLQDADLGRANLLGAHADEHTSWPDGFEPGDYGVIIHGDDGAGAESEDA